VLVVMQMEYARVNKSLQVSCNSSNFVRIAIYHLSILIIQCDVKTVWKLIIKINFWTTIVLSQLCSEFFSVVQNRCIGHVLTFS